MPQFLDLPTEIRLKIYGYLFHGIVIRPQRKIGWNRPAADFTSPALLFANHQFLSVLFSSRHFKSDSPLILTVLLSEAKVLVIDHTDLTAIRRLAASKSSSLSVRAKLNCIAAQANLRTIDFVDKIDEVLCQPADAERLFVGLPGLQTVRLTSPHIHRYVLTVKQMLQVTVEPPAPSDPVFSVLPRTDGKRLFHHFAGRLRKGTIVDVSMLVWQHFLYTGAPYRDQWRVAKMNSLIDAAEKRCVSIVFAFRNVGFAPSASEVEPFDVRTGRESAACDHHFGCTYKAEMSTKDWTLKLIHRGSAEAYTVKQRRNWNEQVAQA